MVDLTEDVNPVSVHPALSEERTLRTTSDDSLLVSAESASMLTSNIENSNQVYPNIEAGSGPELKVEEINPENCAGIRPQATAEDTNTKRDREDETNCSVCLEPWTNSGDHRVASLGCGHLFGKSCILKWLGERKTCPSCNKICKRSEVRDIYVSNVVAMDSAELVSVQQELNRERKARRKAEEELGKFMMQNQVLQACIFSTHFVVIRIFLHISESFVSKNNTTQTLTPLHTAALYDTDERRTAAKPGRPTFQ